MAVGLVPINFMNKSSESALSVYPLAIGNCKENRSVYNCDMARKMADHCKAFLQSHLN